MLEKFVLICFHLYLLLWAILICWRSTMKRMILAILIGSIMSAYVLPFFYDIYQRIRPESSLALVNHLYAIIGYGIVVSIANAIYKKSHQ